MKFESAHTSTREKSRWVQVGLRCQVKSQCISGSRLKARLLAKGCSHVYGLGYVDTFTLVAKMTSVQILVSLATNHWPLHQLDIKNAFLNCILDEEICME